MKRIIFCLFTLLAFLLVLAGCVIQTAPSIENATFFYSDSSEPTPPSLTLHDGRFTFTYSALSSYLPAGTYTLTDTTLRLQTDDGLYTYVFAATNDGFRFDASQSSALPAFADLPDGALFI